LTLALAGGCTSCAGGALTDFSYKLGLKIFFHRPGAAGAPTASPATPMIGSILHGVSIVATIARPVYMVLGTVTAPSWVMLFNGSFLLHRPV